jgi:hypothetical protein
MLALPLMGERLAIGFRLRPSVIKVAPRAPAVKRIVKTAWVYLPTPMEP